MFILNLNYLGVENHIVYPNRKHIVKRIGNSNRKYNVNPNSKRIVYHIGNHNGEIHNNEEEVRIWNMLQEQLTPSR